MPEAKYDYTGVSNPNLQAFLEDQETYIECLVGEVNLSDHAFTYLSPPLNIDVRAASILRTMSSQKNKRYVSLPSDRGRGTIVTPDDLRIAHALAYVRQWTVREGVPAEGGLDQLASTTRYALGTHALRERIHLNNQFARAYPNYDSIRAEIYDARNLKGVGADEINAFIASIKASGIPLTQADYYGKFKSTGLSVDLLGGVVDIRKLTHILKQRPMDRMDDQISPVNALEGAKYTLGYMQQNPSRFPDVYRLLATLRQGVKIQRTSSK